MASRKGGPTPVKKGAVSSLTASMAGLALEPGGGAPPSIESELERRGFAPGLDTLPIYFISTHGAYDVRDAEAPDGSKVPWDVEEETWIVPPGTHIFETMQMGDLCYTEIDQHLWAACQGINRDRFLQFFLHGTPPDEVWEMMFQQLYYYGPGSRVAKRSLAIGGGKREEEGPAYAEPAREPLRRAYINMGFYAFPVGAPANDFPDVPRGEPESRIRSMTGIRTAMIESDVTHTSDEIVDLIKAAERVGGGIFVFSSCAEIHKGDERAMQRTYRERIRLLEQIQADARRDMMSKELPFAPGGSGHVEEGRAPSSRGSAAVVARRALSRRMAAIAAAPGGPVVQGRTGWEESFAPGAEGAEEGNNNNNNGPDLEFANAAGAEELMAQNMATARGVEIPASVPAGRSVYYKIIATAPGQSMIPVLDETGSPFLTPSSLRLALRTTPLVGREVLYKYKKGTTGAMRGKPIFSKVAPGSFGGTRRRKHKKGRYTLRRRA
jgi:hypothetical protein